MTLPLPNLSSNRFPPTPRPFDMTEPFQEHGIWSFWLAADDPVLQYVGNLNCVLNVSYMNTPFSRRPQGRILVRINPRYEHQDVWLWIHELLEIETAPVELDEAWEELLEAVCQSELTDDNFF